VADSDAVVVVEGRSDVITLLRYGVKNAVAVEGTDVPEALASLVADRTATAFLDGDRGGELIFRELTQVADLDHVTFAPEGTAVEDLDREAVTAALRRKVRAAAVADATSPRAAARGEQRADAATTADEEAPAAGQTTVDGDGAATAEPGGDGAPAVPAEAEGRTDAESPRQVSTGTADEHSADGGTRTAPAVDGDSGPLEDAGGTAPGAPEGDAGPAQPAGPDAGAGSAKESASGDARKSASEGETDDGSSAAPDDSPATLAGHVAAVIGKGTRSIRLLDEEFEAVATARADDAVETIADADPGPDAAVLDGTLSQAILDVAAQRGVGQVVARHDGEYVKRPTAVRVRTAEEF
jgi:DNA primase